MQCKLVDRLPSGDQWRYELKLDGYRAEAIKTSAGVRLISRNQKDLSTAYPEIVEAFERLPIREGVFDGEIVAVDPSGKPSFQQLQHLGQPGREGPPLFYFAFDLLNLEGKALLSLPLVERRQLLESVLLEGPPALRIAAFLDGDTEAIAAEICRRNLEGIVGKLASSRYEPDKRSGAWVKWKCGFEQEFVIGGYTRGRGGRSDFGALIIGYYEGGKLR
jgi:bifunctional non-homologous end joining protein LigD